MKRPVLVRVWLEERQSRRSAFCTARSSDFHRDHTTRTPKPAFSQKAGFWVRS